MIKQLYIASNNPGKIKIFRFLCDNIGVELKTFDQKINVVEDGITVKDNAIKKVLAYKHLTDLPIISDDAGVRFPTLNDEPGVKARRWNGLFPEDVDDETWLNYLLGRLKSSNGPHTVEYDISWAIHHKGIIYTKEFTKAYDVVLEPKRPYISGLPMGSIEIDKKTGRYFSEMTIPERFSYMIAFFRDFIEEIDDE